VQSQAPSRKHQSPIGDNSFAKERNAIALGANSIANGQNAYASGTAALAKGKNVIAIGAGSAAYGDSSTSAQNTNSLALIAQTESNNQSELHSGFLVGESSAARRQRIDSAVSNGTNLVAIGANAKATGTGATAMGSDAVSTGIHSIAIGQNANSSAKNASALGVQARANGGNSMAFGLKSKALGHGAQAQQTNAVSIGIFATASRQNSSAFGNNAKANARYSTAIGYGAKTTRWNEVSLGNSYSPYSLPGLSPNRGFINSSYQNGGEKRFVTTDNQGSLGTTNFSVDEMLDTIAATGALSAALGSLPSTTLLPDESFRCGVGTGYYQSQFAGSLGCAVKVNQRLYVNAGIAASPTTNSYSPFSHPMGRFGFTLGFGNSSGEKEKQKVNKPPEFFNNGYSIMQVGDGTSATQDKALEDEPVNQAFINDEQRIAMISNEITTVRSQASNRDTEIEQLKNEFKELRSQKKDTHFNKGNMQDTVQIINALEKQIQLQKEKLDQLIISQASKKPTQSSGNHIALLKDEIKILTQQLTAEQQNSEIMQKKQNNIISRLQEELQHQKEITQKILKRLGMIGITK
jgi:hypothetical protein